MRKTVILILFFICALFIYSYAQTTAGQIQRQEELLRQEEKLRERIQEEARVYIKKIMVEGASLLSEEEIKEITSSFQKRWLTKEDIQQVMESLKQAYKDKGYTGEPLKISYQIKQRSLIIRVEELTH